MSAIKNADRIVFIDNGEVVEDGTHKQLIALKGRYFEMVKSIYSELEQSQGLQTNEEQQSTLAEEVRRYSMAESLDFSIKPVEVEFDHKKDSVKYWASFKRLLRLVKVDWIILTLAVISAIVLGFSLPLFSLVFAEVYGVSVRIKRLTSQCLKTYVHQKSNRYCHCPTKMKH